MNLDHRATASENTPSQSRAVCSTKMETEQGKGSSRVHHMRVFLRLTEPCNYGDEGCRGTSSSSSSGGMQMNARHFSMGTAAPGCKAEVRTLG